MGREGKNFYNKPFTLLYLEVIGVSRASDYSRIKSSSVFSVEFFYNSSILCFDVDCTDEKIHKAEIFKMPIYDPKREIVRGINKVPITKTRATGFPLNS